MKKKLECNLTSCFLCSHCSEEWRELTGLRKTTLFFKKGKTIFNEGEKVTGIYFIYSGGVKVHKKWQDKKELIIRFEKKGGVIGHRGYGSAKLYPVSATAMDDSLICFIENDFFEKTLSSNPALTYKFMQLYSDELQKAELRMHNLALMEVKGRIANTIIELESVFGVDKNKWIAVPISRQEIAAHAGTAYETVFRFLKILVREKIISASGKKIKINNSSRLKRFVEYAEK